MERQLQCCIFCGACDLVLLHAPKFGLGCGLAVHLRTKIRHSHLNLSNIAVKIGNEVLEVAIWGGCVLNGASGPAMPGTLSSGDFQVSHVAISKVEHLFKMDLGDSTTIMLKKFKDFVSVKIELQWAPVVRMLWKMELA